MRNLTEKNSALPPSPLSASCSFPLITTDLPRKRNAKITGALLLYAPEEIKQGKAICVANEDANGVSLFRTVFKPWEQFMFAASQL